MEAEQDMLHDEGNARTPGGTAVEQPSFSMTMGDTEEELRDSWDDDIDIFNDEARVERLSAIAQLQNQNEVIC